MSFFLMFLTLKSDRMWSYQSEIPDCYWHVFGLSLFKNYQVQTRIVVRKQVDKSSNVMERLPY